ncbi:hypothetical protein ABW19_dt0202452 [Dactylella cylindrospora]|nr:hypothetical protein ABW19_dt0202452 [Dactylella cylindrospora]
MGLKETLEAATRLPEHIIADVEHAVLESSSFIRDTWRRVLLNPHDPALVEKVIKALEEDEKGFFEAIAKVEATLPNDLKRFLPVLPSQWVNCVGNQSCFPAKIFHATTRDDLVAAVKYAVDNNYTLKAVGSGHSFSQVCPVYDDSGVILQSFDMNKTLPLDKTKLKPEFQNLHLYHVESGVRIRDLNDRIWDEGYSLINMGAYDAQTLAGAISTGTHGSGIDLGPIASCVKSLQLVTETGKVYQIEPSDGITDPSKFDEDGVELKQNDDWFNTAVVAMGCIGIIYSYVIEVDPKYYLTETRKLNTWEEVKKKLASPSGTLPDILRQYRHYELLVNPYEVKKVHTCIEIFRDKTAEKPHGWRGWKNWFSGLLARCKLAAHLLVGLLNLIPGLSPGLINSALDTLVDQDYVDRSYRVLDIGPVDDVAAAAIELHFDAEQDIPGQVDMVFKYFEEAAKNYKWYLAGPIAVRFTAPSNSLIASESGRYTVAIELDMLMGVTTGQELLKEVTANVKKANPDVRVHWGLDFDTVEGAEVTKDRYPGLDRWMAVYQQLNTTGLFNNHFTDRIGISVKKAT